MTSMDLEKLKMTGAGRAIAVLTSGGDAQGTSRTTTGLIVIMHVRLDSYSALSDIIVLYRGTKLLQTWLICEYLVQ